MLINNLNKSNIDIRYNSYDNIYKIYYEIKYIKLIGITINIKIDHYKKYHNLYYLFIDDIETLKILNNIQSVFQKNISCNLFKNKNKHQKYIICNSEKEIDDNDNINIHISKLKYIYNNYVPIINII